MAKLGAHVVLGPRNGYGDLCSAGMAVVLGVNEGGALHEAKVANGNTTTIFRDTTLYLDAPQGIDQATMAQAKEMADAIYPSLRFIWQGNPAEFYTVLNEPAGNDLAVLPAYLAYEWRMMELAEADGFRLCVLNLATGTPDDGRVQDGPSNGGIQTWKEFYVPHIARAFQGGHIYGRHAYDGGGLERVMQEAQHLLSKGLSGGMVVTELGLQGGYGYVGDDAFMVAAEMWDDNLSQFPNIIGGCMWTLGNWNGANWQTAIQRVAAYLKANPTPPWTPPDNQGPIHEGTHKAVIMKVPQLQEYVGEGGYTREEYLEAAGEAHDDYGRSIVTSADDAIGLARLGNSDSYIKVVDPSRYGQQETIEKVEAAGYRWEPLYLADPEPNVFRVTHWPTVSKRITQRFGARPEVYGQWGLPGHDGVDIAAALGNTIRAVSAGRVYRVELDPLAHNYGIHVRIEHAEGYKSIYAHLSDVPEGIYVGAELSGGTVIGFAGSTGNSSGVHLHFGMKRPPGDEGWPYDLINPEPFLAPFNPIWPEEPTGETVDMLSFMRADPDAWRVVRHADGSQEDFRDYHATGNWWAMQKNSLAEWWYFDDRHIHLREDTSPGPASDGTERCYKVNPGLWCKRFQKVGETFFDGGHVVQFYDKSTCRPHPENSGNSSNTTTVLQVRRPYTFNAYGQNLTLDEVLFVKGNQETQIFARHQGRALGRVAWDAPWGHSEIVELHLDRGQLTTPPARCCQ